MVKGLVIPQRPHMATTYRSHGLKAGKILTSEQIAGRIIKCETIPKKAVYIAIGINLDGRKDVLGMWVGENESAKYWAAILNGLRNRGVEDIFIACTDNLTRFSAAIEAVFPKTESQNCIVHQIRNSTRYVSYKDRKALVADLKAVYAAVDENTAARDSAPAIPASSKIHRLVHFPQQMSLWYQTFCVHHLHHASLQLPSLQHLPHPLLFYSIFAKKSASRPMSLR